MQTELDTRTALFGVFLLGVVVSFVYFVLSTPSESDLTAELQQIEIEERLDEAREIYQSCVSLNNSGTAAPRDVREGCIESRDFLLWTRQFSFAPAYKDVRREFLSLAAALEEVIDAVALRPTSSDAKERLKDIPRHLEAVGREIIQAKQWWRF